MVVTVAFLKGDYIYHTEIEYRQEITIGSGKKDTINVAELAQEQITVKWKKNGISVRADKSYGFREDHVAFNKVIVLDYASRTALYFSPDTSTDAEGVKLPYNCQITLGFDSKNNIVLKLPFISKTHIVFKNESGVLRVEDQNSKNGIYLNGKRVSTVRMKSGDVLSVLSVKIRMQNGILYFDNVSDYLHIQEIKDDSAFDTASHLKANDGYVLYRRSPRMQEKLPTEKIIIANPPAKPAKFTKRRGMFTSLIGSSAMTAASMATGMFSPALLAARGASMVSPVVNIVSGKKQESRQKKKLNVYEQELMERYGAYIQAQFAAISVVADEQREILTRENPSPQECMEVVRELRKNLWERNSFDRDFLDVRLGMGYEALCVEVKTRAQANGFSMEDDELQELAEHIVEETRIVDRVPFRISLRDCSTIGFLGNRYSVTLLVKNLIITLSAMHSPKDVKIVGLFEQEQEEDWRELRWLPHVWDESGQLRMLSFQTKMRFGEEEKTDTDYLCEILNELLKDRKRALEEENGADSEQMLKPHYVFILGSRELMKDQEIMGFLTGNQHSLGITTLLLYNELYDLPSSCQMIVDLNNVPSVYLRNDVNHRNYFTMDERIHRNQFSDFMRKMAAIQLEDMAVEAGIPDSVTFLAGFGVERVEELKIIDRWSKAKPYQTLAAPLGVLSGGKIFSLDIHEKAHGSHGLVAGTTGSGKSEMLMTWILSMAVNYHPHDVIFVLIDYKGGGMANALEALPHVVGKITNIGDGIQRSLVSLESEVKKRQRIFAEYGEICGDQNMDHKKYMKAYHAGSVKVPVPHLIIVSDEFAELKAQQPEFMKNLVSIARIGRSLGVHLILATQKPSGVVDDQIWSNAQWHLCLKVQNAADSREVLHKPDAAKITQPGRCYIQVGNDEYFDLYQSFYSGAAYEPDRASMHEDNNTRIIDTLGRKLRTVPKAHSQQEKPDELRVIRDYIVNTAKEAGINPLDGPWKDELPERLPLAALELKTGFRETEWRESPPWLKVPVGMFDAPFLQMQGIQFVDFAENGHLGIYGAPGTGKTTMLKTLVTGLCMSYPPEDIHIYILDCGGWSMKALEGFPHVGGVALDVEEEKFSKFVMMITKEIQERKRLFLEHSVSSLGAYREVAGTMPAIIIAIDNMQALFELHQEMEQFFITLAGTGSTYGIYLVYTSNSTTGIKYKVLQNIQNAITFEMADKGDYSGLVGKITGKVLSNIAGRAFIKGNPPLEFQAALYAEGENEREQMHHLTELMKKMNVAWTGKRPREIPVLPEKVLVSSMMGEYKIRNRIPIGISVKGIEIYHVDLSENYCFLATGNSRTGKSSLLKNMVSVMEQREDNRFFIFDSPAGVLKELHKPQRGYAVCNDAENVNKLLQELLQLLTERSKQINELKKANAQKVQEFVEGLPQLCIIIDDLKIFVDSVSNEDEMCMDRICRLANGMGVIVLAAGKTTDTSGNNQIEELTRHIVEHQKGAGLDGNVKLYDYFKNNLPLTEKDQELKKGEAYIFEGGVSTRIKLMENT